MVERNVRRVDCKGSGMEEVAFASKSGLTELKTVSKAVH
jgi:hypothetical protein